VLESKPTASLWSPPSWLAGSFILLTALAASWPSLGVELGQSNRVYGGPAWSHILLVTGARFMEGGGEDERRVDGLELCGNLALEVHE